MTEDFSSDRIAHNEITDRQFHNQAPILLYLQLESFWIREQICTRLNDTVT